MYTHACSRLSWQGDQLYLGRRSTRYSIVADQRYPNMWRVGPRFTISLKRSTQNLHLSTSCRPITPSNGTSVWTGRALQAEHD
jgi:hypothetical protein